MNNKVLFLLLTSVLQLSGMSNDTNTAPQVWLVADTADSFSSLQGRFAVDRLIGFNSLTKQLDRALLGSDEIPKVYLPQGMSLSQFLFMERVLAPIAHVSNMQSQVDHLVCQLSYISGHPSQSSVNYLVRLDRYAKSLGCLPIQYAVAQTVRDLKAFIKLTSGK